MQVCYEVITSSNLYSVKTALTVTYANQPPTFTLQLLVCVFLQSIWPMDAQQSLLKVVTVNRVHLNHH